MSRSSMIVEPPFQNALRHQRHEGERCQQRGDGKGPDEIILVVENLDMPRQGIGQAPDVARNNRTCTELTHYTRVAEQHTVEQPPPAVRSSTQPARQTTRRDRKCCGEGKTVTTP